MTIMAFESLESVIDFRGDDYELAYVPEAAQRVLTRWNERAKHYGVVDVRTYV